jgi:N-acyl homoserine lactone hydrolase
MARFDIVMQGSSLRTDQASLGICTIALIKDQGNMLLDTGHFGTRKQILEALKKLGVEPADIDKVILSHTHWDHSLNLELFPKATIIINAKELDFARRVKGDDWATPSVIGLLLKTMKVETIEGDKDLTQTVRVIESPGHSPGHQSVLVKTEKGTALFTQDAMPTMRSFTRELPDFITTTEQEARRSIRKLKALSPDVYYPGHDRPFRVTNGRTEYLEYSSLGIIVRRETEENFRIILGTEEAEKPEKI